MTGTKTVILLYFLFYLCFNMSGGKNIAWDNQKKIK